MWLSVVDLHSTRWVDASPATSTHPAGCSCGGFSHTTFDDDDGVCQQYWAVVQHYHLKNSTRWQTSDSANCFHSCFKASVGASGAGLVEVASRTMIRCR